MGQQKVLDGLEELLSVVDLLGYLAEDLLEFLCALVHLHEGLLRLRREVLWAHTHSTLKYMHSFDSSY